MPDPVADMADVFWLNAQRAESDVEMEATALIALGAAAALGRAREYQPARVLCARVIFEAQPLIAARPALLRATMYALLVAHGFKLMSHVVNAVSGRAVDVTLLPDGAEPIKTLQRHDKPRCTALLVDTRWLDVLSPDDVFLQRWCDGLTDGQHARSISVPSSASLRFEPT